MRCRLESLSSTGCRSTESCTSNASWRAPSSSAERSAGSVFSGYSATLPRRAISSGSRLDGIGSARVHSIRGRRRAFGVAGLRHLAAPVASANCIRPAGDPCTIAPERRSAEPSIALCSFAVCARWSVGLRQRRERASNNPPPPPPPATSRPGSTTRPSEHDLPGVGPSERRRLDFHHALHEPVVLLADRDAAGAGRQLALVRRRAGRRRAQRSRTSNPTCQRPRSSTSARRVDCRRRDAACSAWRSTRNSPTDQRVFLSYTNGATPSTCVSRHLALHARRTTALTLDAAQRADPADASTSPYDEPQRRQHRLRAGRLSSTSASATAAAAATRRANAQGQRPTTLLGKMLRIDVERRRRATPIPPTIRSPAATPSCRPAARAARLPGDLRVRLPQSVALELRSRRPAICGSATWARTRTRRSTASQRGGNYGWRCREGAHCFNSGGTPAAAAHAAASIRSPSTTTALGVSITGGYVYRGTAIPRSSAATSSPTSAPAASGALDRRRAAAQLRGRRSCSTPVSRIASFGQGNDGELYVVDYGGTLNRIVPERRVSGSPCRPALSETGCVERERSEAARRRPDPLRDQRAVLVGWRDQGALARGARRPDHHGRHRRRLGRSRTAACSMKNSALHGA